MSAPINLTRLRERCTEEAPISEQMTTIYKHDLLALIDTAEAAIELDPTLKWIANTYPKAIEEMPTSEYRRFDRLRQTLNRYTTS